VEKAATERLAAAVWVSEVQPGSVTLAEDKLGQIMAEIASLSASTSDLRLIHFFHKSIHRILPISPKTALTCMKQNFNVISVDG